MLTVLIIFKSQMFPRPSPSASEIYDVNFRKVQIVTRTPGNLRTTRTEGFMGLGVRSRRGLGRFKDDCSREILSFKDSGSQAGASVHKQICNQERCGWVPSP